MHVEGPQIPDVDTGDEVVAVVGQDQPSVANAAECRGASRHRCVGRLDEEAIQTAATNTPVEIYECAIGMVSVVEVIEDHTLGK
mmetsp:Transcript_11035/g.32002  ORF Transcript_11035/g.32002 Transcript_11035/m.32002 type:complete len:84 (+) Transcript_11035:1601-1852(+)